MSTIVDRVSKTGARITVELVDGILTASLDGKMHGSQLLSLGTPVVINGKIYTHRINQIVLQSHECEAIWEQQDAYYAEAARTLEAAVPGVTEMKILLDYCEIDSDRFQSEFNAMMDDEYNDGARPPKPIDNSYRTKLKDMIENYPRAALYLRAKAHSDAAYWSDNTGSGAAGRRAMEILADGGSIEDAEIAMSIRCEFVD